MALLGRYQGIVRRLIEKGVDEALAIFSTGWLGIDQTRLSGGGACVELLLDDAGGTLYWQGIASERAPCVRWAGRAGRGAAFALSLTPSCGSTICGVGAIRQDEFARRFHLVEPFDRRLGAPFTIAGSVRASLAIAIIALTKASRVGLASVSVGSIMRASDTIRGK
jgi:hypothetical protein